jgi:integrase
MARLIGRLSARKVKNAKPPKGRDSYDFPDGGNLYLQVSNSTPDKKNRVHVNTSWTFKYELRGRRREMGLGPTHTRSLKEARDEAKRLRRLLLNHIDPIDARDRDAEAKAVEASKNKTFAEVGAEYLRAHEGDWSDRKHGQQLRTSLLKEARAIGNVPVGKMDTSHVLSVLQPIWKSKPESASRLRGRIEAVLGYATAAEYRTRESGNPAKWDGALKHLLGSVAQAKRAKRERTDSTGHHAAVPYPEMPELWRRLRARKSLSSAALQFVILTAARTSEVLGATWDEFDLAEAVWSVPASRMKMRRPHKIPLSPTAVAILKSLPHKGSKPFPLGPLAMLKCLRHAWERGKRGATVHGMRSSFMDFAHERTAFPKVVIDQALAHAITDKVEAAYRRGDLIEKRKQLMGAWADFCQSPPREETSATVTPLRKPRAKVTP